MEIREDFRVRRANHTNPKVEARIAATFERARRIAERESAEHDGAYVVDMKTDLTGEYRPVCVYRDGQLVDES